jgi:hypothetical protein
MTVSTSAVLELISIDERYTAVMVLRLASNAKSTSLDIRVHNANKFAEGCWIEDLDFFLGASGYITRVDTASRYSITKVLFLFAVDG